MFQSGSSRFRHLFRQMVQQSHSLLTPATEQCLICHRTIVTRDYTPTNGVNSTSFTNYLCQNCTILIPWIQQIHCPICGRYEICNDCTRRKQTFFACSRSAVRYDSEMKQWLAQYKYRKNERLTPVFTEMISHAYEKMTLELAQHQQRIHYITYIPLSEERMEERGFNQAERFARGLAERFSLPIVSLLSRSRHTHKQSYKTRAERLIDLQGAFILDRDGFNQFYRIHLGSADNLTRTPNILLVDDVYTTGSTLNQCAKVLASTTLPITVYGLTWAR